MGVPDFQSLMLPLLRMAADGREHSLADARDVLASDFKLSDAELQELLPSGRQPKFANRVAWAKSYLQQAGLLQPRGVPISRSPTAVGLFSRPRRHESTSNSLSSIPNSSTSVHPRLRWPRSSSMPCPDRQSQRRLKKRWKLPTKR